MADDIWTNVVRVRLIDDWYEVEEGTFKVFDVTPSPGPPASGKWYSCNLKGGGFLAGPLSSIEIEYKSD
jgi:hypothetical protein